jgi:hypothetical protein
MLTETITTTGSRMADPYAVREAWLSFVKPAMERGKLEKLPTYRARTPREREQARIQSYYLSRKTFGGFGEHYDRIQWRKEGGSACETMS